MRKIAYLLGFLLFWALTANGQGVPDALMPIPRMQWFLPNGTPNAGGCLAFFNTGTSTPAPTYVDVTGTILNSNPVILDSSGYSTVYLQNQEYRVTMSSAGGVNCATGSQIWSQDGVSAYQILSNAPNIIFAGVNSFPVGVPGELIFRADLGRLCFFNGSWDCIPEFNTIDTLTNKVLTAPTINGGTINSPIVNGVTVNNSPGTYKNLANEGVTGTTINKLAKLTGAPSTGIISAITDTGGVIGICETNCGTTGQASIQESGSAGCVFDGATVAGDYVQISPTVTGDCHDAGVSYPTTGQVIGRVFATGPAGLTTIDLFGPEINATGFPKVIYSTPSAATTTTIGVTTMATATNTAAYRFSGYIDQTLAGAACAGNSTYTVNIVYTEPVSGIANPDGTGWIVVGPAFAGHQTILNNGSIGLMSGNMLPYTLRAKAGTVVQYSVTIAPAGGCAPAPTIQFYPILEQMTAN